MFVVVVAVVELVFLVLVGFGWCGVFAFIPGTSIQNVVARYVSD